MATKSVAARCSVKELDAIITAPSGGMYMMPSHGMDEVYPGLFVGDESAARSFYGLKKEGITHVLNMALGKDRYHVNTNREMYQKEGLVFLGVAANDAKDFKLSQCFEKATNFIENALQNQGRVLVHCREGFSRGATIATAFLMIKRHMTAQSALRLVRSKREVGPNEGFLKELCELNEKLWQSGHFQDQEIQNDDTQN